MTTPLALRRTTIPPRSRYDQLGCLAIACWLFVVVFWVGVISHVGFGAMSFILILGVGIGFHQSSFALY